MKRRFFVICAGVEVLGALLVPPWSVKNGSHVLIEWQPLGAPARDSTINFGVLFVELAVIGVINAVAYLLFAGKRQKGK